MQRALMVAFLAAVFFQPIAGYSGGISRAPAGYYRYGDLGIAQFRSFIQAPLASEHALYSDLAASPDERALMNTMVFKVLDSIPNPYPKVIFDNSRADGLAGVHVAVLYDFHLK